MGSERTEDRCSTPGAKGFLFGLDPAVEVEELGVEVERAMVHRSFLRPERLFGSTDAAALAVAERWELRRPAASWLWPHCAIVLRS